MIQENQEEFENWHWQVRNRIFGLRQFSKVLALTPEEKRGFPNGGGLLLTAVTPYWLSLMDPLDSSCPIRKQVIPDAAEAGEAVFSKGLDHLSENRFMPLPHLIRRFPDRALILLTHHCAVYCRFCTRKWAVAKEKLKAPDGEIEEAWRYIEEREEIKDVLLSGGDPLILEDETIEKALARGHEISHINSLRLCSRMPICLPQRVTPSFCRMLARYPRTWMVVHVNHPKELAPRVCRALSDIASTGTPILSQTVLLHGINDDEETLSCLFQKLVRHRVRPYTLFHCEDIPGNGKFMVSIERGIGMMRRLRKKFSGISLPRYVLDLPGRRGKIQLETCKPIRKDEQGVWWEDWEGEAFLEAMNISMPQALQ